MPYVLQTANGDTKDIIEAILKCHRLYGNDAKEIAQKFRKSDFEKTCKAVFDYVKNNIKYQLDEDGVQVALRAQTTLRKRKADCKGMSLLAGSILHCLGINFSYRFASYSILRDYTHIYVVAHNGTKNIIIDPVWGVYNAEKPTVKTKDFEMKTKVLIGTIMNVLSDRELIDKYYPSVETGLNRFLVVLKNILVPEKFSLAVVFVDQIKADAKKDMKRLLFYNSYSNRFLQNEYDWRKYQNSLAVIYAMNDAETAAIGNVFDDIKKTVNNLGDNIGDNFRSFTDWAGNVISNPADAAKSAAAKVQKNLEAVAGKAESFVDWGAQGFKDFVQDPKKFIKTEARSVQENVQKAWDLTKTYTLYVPRNAFLALVRINAFNLAERILQADRNKIGERWHALGGNRTTLFETAELGSNATVQIGEAVSTSVLVAEASAVLASLATILGEARKLKEGAEDTKNQFDDLKSQILKEVPDFDFDKNRAEGDKAIEEYNAMIAAGGDANKKRSNVPLILGAISILGLGGWMVFGRNNSRKKN